MAREAHSYETVVLCRLVMVLVMLCFVDDFTAGFVESWKYKGTTIHHLT
jgi:hypothetical protein